MTVGPASRERPQRRRSLGETRMPGTEAQSDSEKMTQVWPHEFQEPCNDQEEQWDDVMPEPAPKNDNTIRSRNRATGWARPRRWRAGEAGKLETNQESFHLDSRKHGSHHGRCPANSTTVDAAKVEWARTCLRNPAGG